MKPFNICFILFYEVFDVGFIIFNTNDYIMQKTSIHFVKMLCKNTLTYLIIFLTQSRDDPYVHIHPIELYNVIVICYVVTLLISMIDEWSQCKFAILKHNWQYNTSNINNRYFSLTCTNIQVNYTEDVVSIISKTTYIYVHVSKVAYCTYIEL